MATNNWEIHCMELERRIAALETELAFYKISKDDVLVDFGDELVCKSAKTLPNFDPDPTPLTGCLLCVVSALTVICGVMMFVTMICEGVR